MLVVNGVNAAGKPLLAGEKGPAVFETSVGGEQTVLELEEVNFVEGLRTDIISARQLNLDGYVDHKEPIADGGSWHCVKNGELQFVADAQDRLFVLAAPPRVPHSTFVLR